VGSEGAESNKRFGEERKESVRIIKKKKEQRGIRTEPHQLVEGILGCHCKPKNLTFIAT